MAADNSWFFKESQHSQLYQKYRVTYPPDVYSYILSNLNTNKVNDKWPTALDIGCGTGQATLPLASFFDNVIGVDPSETQLTEAKQAVSNLTNVEFKVGSASDLSFQPSDSVDLITSAAAAHYFDIDAFYKEAFRVLRPNGVLAVYSYGLPHIVDPEVQKIMIPLYAVQLKDYWPTGFAHVRNSYKDIFEAMSKVFSVSKREDSLKIDKTFTVDNVIGFLRSMSSYQRYRQENPSEDPLIDIKKQLLDIYGTDETRQEIRAYFSVFVLIAIKTSGL